MSTAWEDNSHLLAAAPDMLDALTAMLAVGESAEPIVAQIAAVKKARAAIAKAKGDA